MRSMRVLAQRGSKGSLRGQKNQSKGHRRIKKQIGKRLHVFTSPWNMIKDGEFPGARV